ncbi:MAG: putative ABC transporter permease [Clostridiales bacterium]|nr:putative ABC transporter permease [Clostridiales bacterium]
MPLLYQCLIGGAAITAVEFVAGCVVNLWWGLGVWDYSGVFLNVLGQICLPFFFLWCLLAAVGIWLYDFLNWKLLNAERPHYKFI